MPLQNNVMEESNKFYRLINQKLSSGKPELDPDFRQDLENRLVREGLIKDKGNNNKWIFFGCLALLISTFAWYYGNDKSLMPTSSKESNGSVATLNTNSQPVINIKPETKNSSSVTSENQQLSVTQKNNSETKPKNNPGSSENLLANNSNTVSYSNSDYANSRIQKSLNNDELTNPSNTVDINHSSSNSTGTANEDFSYAVVAAPLAYNSNALVGSSSEPTEMETDNQSETALSANVEEATEVAANDSVTPAPEVASVSPLDEGPFSFTLDMFVGPQLSNLQSTSSGNGGGSGNGGVIDGKTSDVVFGVAGNVYRNNFTLGLGVNYSNYQSTLSTTYTYGSDSNAITLPIKVKTQFNILDIPLVAGYLFNFGKFGVQLEGGASMAFICNAGSYVSTDTSTLAFPVDSIKPSGSYSNLIAQLGFLYSVNSRFSAFFQPSFRYGLTGVVEQGPAQKINTYSIRAGLRIKF